MSYRKYFPDVRLVKIKMDFNSHLSKLPLVGHGVQRFYEFVGVEFAVREGEEARSAVVDDVHEDVVVGSAKTLHT